MRKWMPKLKRIGKSKIPKIASHDSLKEIFGKAKPKFYFGKGNEVLAVASIPRKGFSSRTATVAVFNRKKARFEPLAKAVIVPYPTSVKIEAASKLPERYHSVETIPGRVVRLYTRKKTGFNVFRLFLNEAIEFAEEKNLKTVLVSAQNSDLRSYYESLGFKFLHPKVGFFEIK